MSYTTMIRVNREGQMEEVAEFRNAWGSAPRVWDAISEKYCGGKMAIMMKDDEAKAFWNLAGDKRLSFSERATFAMTFDKMIVEVANAKVLAGLLREFELIHPNKEGRVNHLPAIAAELEKHADDDCIGFCFIMTSVSGDCWYLPDVCKLPFHDKEQPEDEECDFCHNAWQDRSHSRLFRWDMDKDKGYHWLLFSELEKSAQDSNETQT